MIKKRRGKKKADASLPVKYSFPNIPVADAALRHYVRKINEYPILTEDEERKLIESFRKHKNVEAARELIQVNLRLVVKIALEYRQAIQNVMDAIQEGNIGLMKAVQMYDPKKGTRLGYYASWWIRSYILKFIMDNFRLVKVGTTQEQKKLFFNLIREKQKIEAQGFETAHTRKLLSDKFSVSEDKIDEMTTRLSHSEKSLNTPLGHGTEDLYLVDMMADEQPSALDRVLDEERKQQLMTRLQEFAKTLSKKEQIILKKRMLAEVPKTLQALGAEFGVTKERVRQLQNRLAEKIKLALKDVVNYDVSDDT